MKALVVGGTRFVGRHVVEALLAAGDEVTLLHRGTGPDLFSGCEHLHVDRDGDLGVLDGRSFDATIDTSAYFPRQVRSLVDALGQGIGRYVVISSTSVYGPPARPGFDESSPTVEPAAEDLDDESDETYGERKVAIEDLARELLGERATVVRPTYVVGPWDRSQRFTYWVRRLAAGGEVLAPGNPADPIQVIDARDMARWIVRLVHDDVTGTFHAVSPPPPYSFADLLADVSAAVAPEGTTLTWVDETWLLAQGEDGASLPMWGGGDPWIAANAADPAAAAATGLEPRPVRQSASEILQHVEANPWSDLGPGISRERETALLAAWHARA
jgi:2'-hydroxyisoflavone reductase